MFDDDYKVGYKKPPKKNQFKKGKTGNAKGRPKKPKPQFEEPFVTNQTFEITVDGKAYKVQGYQLLQQLLLQEARKGKVQAARALLKFAGYSV